MKKFILLLILLPITLLSQITEYHISLCGRDQEVILINKNDQIFRGAIISHFFNKKSGRKINKRTRIKKEIAKMLFTQLTDYGIEKLAHLDSKQCGENYIDGGYLSFSVKKNDQILFTALFDEVYPESESEVEKNLCRRKGQLLVTTIDKEINLKRKYLAEFNKRSKNTCYWSGGIYMNCKAK